MRHEELENICQAVESGGETRVKHIVTNQVGRIVACEPNDLVEVELQNGDHRSWSRENISLQL